MTEFDATDPATWLARGRTADEAEALARAWQDYPDLPPTAPAEEQRQRRRARLEVLKPLDDPRTLRRQRELEETNFAFVAQQIETGKARPEDVAKIRGRDTYGYDWLQASAYGHGWYAAAHGSEFRYVSFRLDCRVDERHRQPYRQGFLDGGGRPDELFDTARRQYAVAAQAPVPNASDQKPATARLSPTTWPTPSDAPRPTAWTKRLLIIAAADQQASSVRTRAIELYDDAFFRMLRATPGAADATIVVLSAVHGFIAATEQTDPSMELMTEERAARLSACPQERAKLEALVAGREFDDILLRLDDPYLQVLEAHSAALPIARNMERTRHTVLLSRTQLRAWLTRGLAPGQNRGGGHIRWGKVHKGLTGKLGEFVARYGGRVPGRGHLIRIELESGELATGYTAADGKPLPPERYISNKSRLRDEMTEALRSFGGATRLGAPRAKTQAPDLFAPTALAA